MDWMHQAINDITDDVVGQLIKTGMYNGATLSELDPDRAQAVADQIATTFSLRCIDADLLHVRVQNLLLEQYKGVAAEVARRQAPDLADRLRVVDQEEGRALLSRRLYGVAGVQL